MDTETLALKAELLKLLTEDPEIREATGKAALPAVIESAKVGRLGAALSARVKGEARATR